MEMPQDHATVLAVLNLWVLLPVLIAYTGL